MKKGRQGKPAMDDVLEQAVQHKGALLHELHVKLRAIGMLAVSNGVLERILELCTGTEKILLRKTSRKSMSGVRKMFDDEFEGQNFKTSRLEHIYM